MVRIKHRYLLLNILSPSTSTPISSSQSSLPTLLTTRPPLPPHITPQLLLRLIREGIAELYGDYGMGIAGSGGLAATSTAIIRCSRATYRLVWAACTFVTRLPGGRSQGSAGKQKSGYQAQGQGLAFAARTMGNEAPRDVVVRVVRVSGTIRKAEEEAVRRARREILRARRKVEVGGGGGLGLGLGLEALGDGRGEDENEDEDVEIGDGGIETEDDGLGDQDEDEDEG
ncbi:hypothetical protein MMC09_006867 [Bachmanniomyces sp. S44760]|nr:hypothetical protein [Bachmanniomyces sp. S44760]